MNAPGFTPAKLVSGSIPGHLVSQTLPAIIQAFIELTEGAPA